MAPVCEDGGFFYLDNLFKLERMCIFVVDKRGYDELDEYIREVVLRLSGEESVTLEKVVGECASRIYNSLLHQAIEPGTKEAYEAYVSCLHQLYLMGAAMMLKRMGYHMSRAE